MKKNVIKYWNPLFSVKYSAQDGMPHPDAFTCPLSPPSLIPKHPPTSTKDELSAGVCAVHKHKGGNNSRVRPKESQRQGKNSFSTSGNPT